MTPDTQPRPVRPLCLRLAVTWTLSPLISKQCPNLRSEGNAQDTPTNTKLIRSLPSAARTLGISKKKISTALQAQKRIHFIIFSQPRQYVLQSTLCNLSARCQRIWPNQPYRKVSNLLLLHASTRKCLGALPMVQAAHAPTTLLVSFAFVMVAIDAVELGVSGHCCLLFSLMAVVFRPSSSDY